MDARWLFPLACTAGLLVTLPAAKEAQAAAARTRNFVVVHAASPELAQQVSQAAEKYRKELAERWLGQELPPWNAPCTIQVVAGNRPAEGVTKYEVFDNRVDNFRMQVVGTPERILDSVLPHEVTHTILATHFQRPLPRWADEGVCTTVEHVAEKSKQDIKLHEFLTSGRGIPMNELFLMREYPPEMLTLYSQGYSVCRFLIAQKGSQEFIHFIESYFQGGSWTKAVRDHYAYESLSELQDHWLAWVRSGSESAERFQKHSPTNQPEAGQQAPGAAAPAGRPQSARATPANDPPSIVNAAADGWYHRQRNQALASGEGNVPQSVTVAQPRGEQGIASPSALGNASSWAPNQSSVWR